MSGPAPTSPAFSVFAHLNVDKTPLYRAILTLFVAERARFVIARDSRRHLGCYAPI